MIEELINGRLLLRSNHLGRDALDKLLRMRQEGVLVDVTVRAGDRCRKNKDCFFFLWKIDVFHQDCEKSFFYF